MLGQARPMPVPAIFHAAFQDAASSTTTTKRKRNTLNGGGKEKYGEIIWTALLSDATQDVIKPAWVAKVVTSLVTDLGLLCSSGSTKVMAALTKLMVWIILARASSTQSTFCVAFFSAEGKEVRLEEKILDALRKSFASVQEESSIAAGANVVAAINKIQLTGYHSIDFLKEDVSSKFDAAFVDKDFDQLHFTHLLLWCLKAEVDHIMLDDPARENIAEVLKYCRFKSKLHLCREEIGEIFTTADQYQLMSLASLLPFFELCMKALHSKRVELGYAVAESVNGREAMAQFLITRYHLETMTRLRRSNYYNLLFTELSINKVDARLLIVATYRPLSRPSDFDSSNPCVIIAVWNYDSFRKEAMKNVKCAVERENFMFGASDNLKVSKKIKRISKSHRLTFPFAHPHLLVLHGFIIGSCLVYY